MSGFSQSLLNVLKVLDTPLLLTWSEIHYRVVEQREVSLHSVIALRRTHFDKLLSDVDYAYFEIIALEQFFCQVASSRNNHTVASIEAIVIVIKLEGCIALIAVGMADIARI